MTRYRIIERNDGLYVIQQQKFDHHNESYWDKINNIFYANESDALLALKDIDEKARPDGIKRIIKEVEI